MVLYLFVVLYFNIFFKLINIITISQLPNHHNVGSEDPHPQRSNPHQEHNDKESFLNKHHNILSQLMLIIPFNPNHHPS
jgi:hypothetical protein